MYFYCLCITNTTVLPFTLKCIISITSQEVPFRRKLLGAVRNAGCQHILFHIPKGLKNKLFEVEWMGMGLWEHLKTI